MSSELLWFGVLGVIILPLIWGSFIDVPRQERPDVDINLGWSVALTEADVAEARRLAEIEVGLLVPVPVRKLSGYSTHVFVVDRFPPAREHTYDGPVDEVEGHWERARVPMYKTEIEWRRRWM